MDDTAGSWHRPEAETGERLIRAVGERVRAARVARGLPRRVVSERSGVSPRYLAQLEAGKGNISIALLQQVAAALGERVDHLVADPASGEAARMADLFRRAPAAVQDQVRALLCPEPLAGARAQRICLIGLRGAGKSTLGALAGQALDVPFIELNREIEAEAGMAVTEILALYGPDGYRRLEAQAVERVIATHARLILAVAGGLVAEEDTYATLLSRFHTVWLKARPEEHMSRVRAQGDTRPMAGNPEAMVQLRSILHAREALYARAQETLDTSDRGLEEAQAALVALIRARGFLKAT